MSATAQSILAKIFHTGFSATELADMSLCVGWVVALSTGQTDDALHRRATAMRANSALVRLLGEGYHATLIREIEVEAIREVEEGET